MCSLLCDCHHLQFIRSFYFYCCERPFFPSSTISFVPLISLCVQMIKFQSVSFESNHVHCAATYYIHIYPDEIDKGFPFFGIFTIWNFQSIGSDGVRVKRKWGGVRKIVRRFLFSFFSLIVYTLLSIGQNQSSLSPHKRKQNQTKNPSWWNNSNIRIVQMCNVHECDPLTTINCFD